MGEELFGRSLLRSQIQLSLSRLRNLQELFILSTATASSFDYSGVIVAPLFPFLPIFYLFLYLITTDFIVVLDAVSEWYR